VVVGRELVVRLLPLALVGVLILPAEASATTDRANYVAQAESACAASGGTFSLHAFKIAKRHSRYDEELIRGTLRALETISKQYGRLTQRLSQIPPAPGDEALVERWLATRVRFKSFEDRGIQALRARRIGKFRYLARKQHHFKKKVWAALDAFGTPSPFYYCVTS
jgi:hypothetical protein